jgi:hypothetical protein
LPTSSSNEAEKGYGNGLSTTQQGTGTANNVIANRTIRFQRRSSSNNNKQ